MIVEKGQEREEMGGRAEAKGGRRIRRWPGGVKVRPEKEGQ